MTARQCALKALNRCTGKGSWSAQTIDAELKKSGLEGSDAALATRLVLGVLQNRDLLDFMINGYAARPEKLDPEVRNILRLGAYQLKKMDRIPPHAAVSESVELCRKAGYSSASGLVNAVLRKIASGNVQPESLAVKYSHPQWFVDRMIAEHGYEFTEALLAANNREPETVVHPAFSGEETYVQDEAAYEAVRMAKPKPGMRVLDACSAPGGKSFTAAVLMENCGEIISCDIHEKKLRLVAEGAERLGIQIISVCPADAGEYRPDWASSFDLVISDVPCSGLGVIRKKPEIRFKTADEIAGLPEIQLRILRNTARYVKPGGKLLYSTCTILPEENEGVVSAFLEKNENYVLLRSRTFTPNIDGTDGFFAAVLQRKL